MGRVRCFPRAPAPGIAKLPVRGDISHVCAHPPRRCHQVPAERSFLADVKAGAFRCRTWSGSLVGLSPSLERCPRPPLGKACFPQPGGLSLGAAEGLGEPLPTGLLRSVLPAQNQGLELARAQRPALRGAWGAAWALQLLTEAWRGGRAGREALPLPGVPPNLGSPPAEAGLFLGM